ncbi:MAG: serine hydrolase domain-containing protein [Hyphomicrobiales bacterium]
MTHRNIMCGFPPPPEARATLANWRMPPFNRWAFRHVREIVPSATIPRCGRRLRLDRAIEPLDRLAFEAPDGRETTIARLVADTYTDGMIVLRRGRVVFEAYEAGHDGHVPHIVFSVSKSLTALVAGILADRGLLDPDEPVTDYLPEAANSAYGDCTVRHVLDMTVSIAFEENYLDATGAFARYREATGWNPVSDPARPQDLRSFLLSLEHGPRPHGEIVHYVSPNTDLLGWIVERAAGQRFSDLMASLLWQPMGAESNAYVTVDRLGAPRTAGGICATLRDLARVGEVMRCRGVANGRQVVPGWWVDDILSNGDPEVWAKSDTNALLPNGRYRSLWYVTGNAHGAFYAFGIHGQWIYVDPPSGVVVAKQSSWPDPLDDSMERLHLAGYDAIVRALAQ